MAHIQARNQLGTPGGRRVFQEGENIFKLCPLALKYVQHILPGRAKIFLGGLRLPWVRAFSYSSW